jgi:hypothetical protein
MRTPPTDTMPASMGLDIRRNTNLTQRDREPLKIVVVDGLLTAPATAMLRLRHGRSAWPGLKPGQIDLLAAMGCSGLIGCWL